MPGSAQRRFEVDDLMCPGDALDLLYETRQRKVQAGVTLPGVLRRNDVMECEDRDGAGCLPARQGGEPAARGNAFDQRACNVADHTSRVLPM